MKSLRLLLFVLIVPNMTIKAQTIDVAFFYTNKAAFKVKKSTNLSAYSKNLVKYVNDAFKNSGVSGRLRLVHHEETGYSESYGPMGLKEQDNPTQFHFMKKHKEFLSHYYTEQDSEFDEEINTSDSEVYNQYHAYLIQQKREKYGADLVFLICEVKGQDSKLNACGIGPSTWKSDGDIDSPGGKDFDDREKAFAVLAVGSKCCPVDNKPEDRRNLFAHEVGHALGLRHDKYTDKISGVDWGEIRNNGNFGYVNKEEKYRTIMTYHRNCAKEVGDICDLIPVFSSPDIFEYKGRKVKVGDKYRNCAKFLNDNMKIVAGYREQSHDELK